MQERGWICAATAKTPESLEVSNPPLVLVEWVDSYGCSANWSDLENPRPRPMVCKSVGWLYHDGKDCKLIVPHVSDGDPEIPKQGCGDMTIPTSAVRKIIKLKTVGR